MTTTLVPTRSSCLAALHLFLAALASAAAVLETPSYLAEEAVQMEAFAVTGRRDESTYVADHSVTLTKTDTPLVNTPQAISIITRELIDDTAMRGLGDVTRYAPGVGFAQGEGNRDTVVLRGNSTTADYFIDGIRDDTQYLRDLYNSERVEMIKGPNAMIFGRGATGGLVNRVTKQATGQDYRALTFQAGSDDQYRASADLGGRISSSLSWRLAGVYEDSDSYRDGVTLRRYGLNPTFTYRLAPGTTVRFGYEFFHDERVADRGVPSFQGRPLRTDPSQFFGDAGNSPVEATVHTGFVAVEHRLASNLVLRNHTRFANYDKFYQNVFPGAVNAAGSQVAVSAYSNATDRANLFNQTDLVWNLSTGGVKHQLLAGVELGRQVTDNFRRTGYYDTISPTTTSVNVSILDPRPALPITFRQSATDADNRSVAELAAVYVQDQMELLPRLHAIAGLRFDHFTVDLRNNRTGASLRSRDELVSPRLGLIFKPAPSFSVYASTSMAHLPRAGEQLASLNAGNRALDPEEFRNYEFGLKWDARSDLSFTAAVYRLDRTNVAITDPADPTRMILVDGQRTGGLEISAVGRLAPNWSIVGSYAYQGGELRAGAQAGNRLAQLPRHTVSLWNRYDFNSRWGAGVGVIHRDEFFASTDQAVTVPGFTRVDAAVFCRLSDRVRAQVNLENVFDREYFVSAHNNNNITPGSPRALRVSLTTTF